MVEQHTIVAVTTAPGEGGIGVVEVHGPLAERSVLAHLHAHKPIAAFEPGRLYHGIFRAADGRPLDEVLVRHVPSSESLTGLACVEVHCHGGPAPIRSVLDAVIAEGVVETSWQGLIVGAFRGGRIDATRAEAGLLLPGASTPLAAGMLHDQWEGALARAIEEARDRAAVEALRATVRTGIALVRPLTVVIAGPPNVGKSTLFNVLLDDVRAIVHHEPGTTRDPVRATTAIEGFPFTLIDTAGIGTPVGPLDRLAQERSTGAMAKADIVIGVVETGEDVCRALKEIRRLAGNRPFIGVLNKVDIRGETGIADGIRGEAGVAEDAIRVSALKRTGLDALRRAVVRAAAVAGESVKPGAAVVFTERQERVLAEALDRISDEGWHGRMVRRLQKEWEPEA